MKSAAKLSLTQWVILLPLRAYRRFLSPLKSSPSCRFHPTCSKYAVDAVKQHGARKGSYLALRRLLKCHPFHPGGFDPVPAVRQDDDNNDVCSAEGNVHAEGDTFARALTRRNFER